MTRGAVFLALAVLGPAAGAQETGTDPPPGAPATAPAASVIACKVNGYDIMLTNTGDEAIAVGAAIAWSVPFARRAGVLTLTRPLAPQGTTAITGANGSSYLTPRIPCEANLSAPEAPAIPTP